MRRVLHFDAPAPLPASAPASLLLTPLAAPAAAPAPAATLGDVRSLVVERLIELVETQARDIASLQAELRALNARVDSLEHAGFPHLLELRLDGRPAAYTLSAAAPHDKPL